MDNVPAFQPGVRSAVTPMHQAERSSLSPADDYQQQPSDWQRYVTAVLRHRWIVLLVTLAGSVAGVVGTQFLDPRYSAKAMLWIDAAGHERRDDPIAGQEVVAPLGWVELITANAVLDSVVREQRLYLQPHAYPAAFDDLRIIGRVVPGRYRLTVSGRGERFALASDDGTVVQRGVAGDTAGGALGLSWLPPLELLRSREVRFDLTTPHDAARDLARALKVQLDPGGSFIGIELRGADPVRTAVTVNAIAERAVTVAADLKREKFEELAKILGERVDRARRTLRSAEAALAAFRVRTADILMPGTDVRSDPTLQTAFDLRVELEQARRDRQVIETILNEASDEGLRVEALAMIDAVRRSPQLSGALDELTRKQAELRALRARYTVESAPAVELQTALATLERHVIPQLSRELATELAAQEADLSSRESAASARLRDAPPLALEAARLERDVASAEELFSTVRRRHEETGLALLSSLPDIRVLDAAEPTQRPVSNFAPLLVTLSLVTSLGLAVIGATVWDRLDPKVRYPEQVTHRMRLPILGAVPRVAWRIAPRVDAGDVEVIEALRGLRVRVLYARNGTGPLLLTVTSPGAGDGKSFVSANLALSFAYAGYRTLLIDGDVRRGVLHRVLDVPRRPGLTDVLTGRAALREALRETAFGGLTLLSAGTRLQRGPELLLSDRLREMIAELRTTFGVIIVDSSPLGAGVDPLVLGTVTEDLLLVLRSGASDLPLALSQIEAVESLPVRPIGAVLNDVRGNDAFRYYTYDLAAYSVPDEEPSPSGDGGLSILGGRP
jgi:capsular exopolysaccharide synthesis family protein